MGPAGASSLTAVEAKVSVGSRPDVAPQNFQNEPAVAIDAHRPNVVAAGANDTVDFPPCPQSLATEEGVCALRFEGGVGLSGVYFSFDGGRSWTQPTYTGTTGYDCALGDACPPHVGPTHTLPWYSEAGLFTWGDPALAFGTVPVDGRFSWDNGSRLYYGTLVIESQGMTFPKTGPEYRGLLGLAVSRLDNATPERVALKSSWARPVIVSNRNSATSFSDKDSIWADNAASSPYFGNAYICWDQDQSLGRFHVARAIDVAVSRDGGDTWSVKQASPATQNIQRGFKVSCTLRTDSHGVVYLMYPVFAFGLPGVGDHVLQKSYDGGRTWSRPKRVLTMNDACYQADLLVAACVMDGLGGARTDISAAASIDIANGAPTGDDATDQIVNVWSDGRYGFNDERALLSWSTDGGDTWHEPVPVSAAGDRSMYAAPSISPDGTRLYVVYQALTAPWRGDDFFSPRPLHGVFRTAALGPDGSPGAWTTLADGPLGDARGSSGHDIYQERLGDYVFAASSRTYGVGLWTDVRDAAVCDAVQSYRDSSTAAGERVLPAPWPLAACDPQWGNKDIWAATTAT